MTDRPFGRMCHVFVIWPLMHFHFFKCGHFVRSTDELDYVAIVVLNMQLQPNFGTAQAYLAITCGFVSETGSWSYKTWCSRISLLSRATKVWNKGHLWQNVLHKVLAEPARYPLSSSDPGKFSVICARLRSDHWPHMHTAVLMDGNHNSTVQDSFL